MSSFYVTLFSSASRGTYAHNHSGNFITTLHNEIKLGSDYEVALVSMHYVGQKWANIPQNESHVIYKSMLNNKRDFVCRAQDVEKMYLDLEPGKLICPVQDYTWENFKRELNIVFNDYYYRKKVQATCVLTDYSITINNYDVTFTVKLSTSLYSLLNFDSSKLVCSNYTNVFKISEPPVVLKDATPLVDFYEHKISLNVDGRECSIFQGEWLVDSIFDQLLRQSNQGYECSVTDIKSEVDGSIKAKVKIGCVSDIKFPTKIKEMFGITINEIKGSPTKVTTEFDVTFQPFRDKPITLSIGSSCTVRQFVSNLESALNKIAGTNFIKIKLVETSINHVNTLSIQIKFTSSNHHFKLSDYICQKFGFPSMTNKWFDSSEAGYMNSDVEYDVFAKNKKSFWVYTDIIEDQYVGSALSNLLRIVPYNAMEGQMHIESFDPYYIPVSRRYVSNIEIRIVADDDVVEFEHEVVIVLHFKQI